MESGIKIIAKKGLRAYSAHFYGSRRKYGGQGLPEFQSDAAGI
jgi:hypothetical protein